MSQLGMLDDEGHRLTTDLLRCVDHIATLNVDGCGSISSRYALTFESMRPALDDIWKEHSWRGALLCAMFLVRSPIATYMWDVSVCHSTAVAKPGCKTTTERLIAGLTMPHSSCVRLQRHRHSSPPLRMDPTKINSGTGFPPGHDFHPFGLYLAHKVRAGEASLDDIFRRVFPSVLCGNTEKSTRMNWPTYVPMTDGCGTLLSHQYAAGCPHLMSVHTLVAKLVSSADRTESIALLKQHLMSSGLARNFTFSSGHGATMSARPRVRVAPDGTFYP